MGNGCGRVGLAAFAVLAAGCFPVLAEQRESPVYWAEGAAAGPASQAAFVGEGQPRARRPGKEDVSARQLDPAAAPRSFEMSAFETWYFRRSCRAEAAPSAFCRRNAARVKPADFADALTRAPDAATAKTLDEVSFPVIEDIPPVVYLEKYRRKEWLFGRLEAPPLEPGESKVHPCEGGLCQQYAGIAQSASGNGIDIAGIVQAGPNVAIIAQQVNGPAFNIASVGQWGACNQALVLQSASTANNTAIVNQAGYRNSAVVFQH